MRRILFFISVLFSVLISCSDDIQKYDADVYENAVKYLSQNMNKYVKNNIISQKWENDNLAHPNLQKSKYTLPGD